MLRAFQLPPPLLCHRLMHEVTPKVVAMAVSMVMTMFRILPQRFLLLFSIVFLILAFHHRFSLKPPDSNILIRVNLCYLW